MSVIGNRLKEVVDHDVLVVQTDGKAFKGTLVEFDDEFILLHDCLETSTKEVKWKNIIVPLPSTKDKVVRSDEGGLTYGEKERKVAMLKKVMINVQHVVRIWLWDPEDYTPKEFSDIGVISF